MATDPVRQQIVIVARGTTNLRNWMTDAVFIQLPCDLAPGCLVHGGFLNAWNEISTVVSAAVKKATATNPAYTVAAVGHSLGGAVTTLAAAHLRQAGRRVDLYTYGSPRVGNSVFASVVDAQPGGVHYRVTHFDDPVPRLPPLIFNYRHASTEYWLAPGGATRVNYAASDVRLCPGAANLGCNAATLGLDVSAHLYYLQEVAACSPGGPLPWKRQSQVSDAELEMRLDRYGALDAQYVATLGAEALAS